MGARLCPRLCPRIPVHAFVSCAPCVFLSCVYLVAFRCFTPAYVPQRGRRRVPSADARRGASPRALWKKQGDRQPAPQRHAAYISRRNIAQSQGFFNPVPVSSRGHTADHLIVAPDRLVADDVGPFHGDLKRNEALLFRAGLFGLASRFQSQ